jgi:hypothetical protein
MGRFALGAPELDSSAQDLRWAMRLFGRGAGEQDMSLSVTRGAETQLLQLTPANAQRRLLPQGWRGWLADGADPLAAPGRRLVVPALLLLAASLGLWRLLGALRSNERKHRPGHRPAL